MSDEQREAAAIRITSYQRRLVNSYNRRVKPRVFRPGDLVLRKVVENTVDPTAGKFQPKREGPYVVMRTGEAGTYAIDKTDGTPENVECHVPEKVLSIKTCHYLCRLTCLRIFFHYTGSNLKARIAQ